MLDVARGRLAAYEGQVDFVHADLTQPLALGEPFDAVMSVAAFHWIPDHVALFAHLAEAMAPGARLTSDCGGRGNLDVLNRAIAQVTGETDDDWEFAGAADTRARLEGAGFDVERRRAAARPLPVRGPRRPRDVPRDGDPRRPPRGRWPLDEQRAFVTDVRTRARRAGGRLRAAGDRRRPSLSPPRSASTAAPATSETNDVQTGRMVQTTNPSPEDSTRRADDRAADRGRPPRARRRRVRRRGVLRRAARRAAGVGAPAGHAARRGADPARGRRAARPGRAGARPGPRARRRAALHAAARRASTTATAVVLARAFTAYFQLVNITEQLHRWQELTGRRRGPARGDRRPDRARRSTTASLDRDLLDRGARPARVPPRLHRPPHRGQPPLGAAACCARSPRPSRGRGPAPPALERRRATSAAWPSWSTCCGRPTSCASCARARRTRPARPSTTCARSPREVVPDLLEELDRSLAPHRRRAAGRPPGRCASAPGPAATATATPTSRPR